jgi:predicted ATPase/class 3 adenylate cyclase
MALESGAEQSKSPATLPTGTVTFLFSDIEGSTQKWERHRDAMKAAVARQEDLMRAAISGQGGYIFKTLGDAFCAAFPTAPQAASAAIDAQRALGKEDFSKVEGLLVRMGLHTGYAEERNADYFGPAVNRVARIMSVGHGGQVLLSEVTRELAHGDLPAGVSLLDLGSHRLRDLTEPEHVWQLTIEDIPAEFPPLRSLDALPNNLPNQPTSFCGRDHDLEEVKSLLAKHQLLTLTGAGGIGKTRLALQVGADLLDRYSDGVWLADLAPITDQALVSSVIAQVLGMTQVEGRRVDESLPLWLKRKNLLLILDNCEHLLETVAKIADSIVRNCPHMRLLATSRQALGIGGEHVLRLASLDVPHKIADLTPAAVMKFDAVTLFVDRAGSVDRTFALTADNAPIIAEICRRLDGIPLAIELAAARVKVLSIPNLAQRLNERFKILTGGSRTALPRQKTLSALIDWSYDLLTPQEQLLFIRLSIFAGGFGLDAATTICGGEGLDEIDVLDLLTSLTDKSLVVADTTGAQERYHLLESTRAYALDKLTTAGQREHTARRHAEYYRDRVQAADELYGTGSTFEWVAEIELDLDNCRAALEWCITKDNDRVLGGAIAGALERLWRYGGLTVEGRHWIGLALKRTNETDHAAVAARLWFAEADLTSGKSAVDAAEHALRLYESARDARGAARARARLAYSLLQIGRIDEANEMASQAITTLRELEEKWWVSYTLVRQAGIASDRGEMEVARDLFAQALASFKAVGDEFGISLTLINLGEKEFAAGCPDEALRLVSEALEIDSRGKDAFNLAIDFANVAAYRIAVGDLQGSSESARRGLQLGREAQYAMIVPVAIQHIALIAALRGQLRTSAQLAGFVDAQFKTLIQQRQPTEQWGYDKLMAALRGQLSEAEIEKLGAEGAAWSEDRAVEEALKI